MAPARYPNPKRLVLDTSLFVNPDVRAVLGPTPTDALDAFLAIASEASPLYEFYMPPSVFEELTNFIQRDRVPARLFLFLTLKAPSRHEIMLPAAVLYDLIEDMRERVNKGLRIAENGVRGALTRGADETIKDVRRKYRDALREGVIDSKEDVDLLLLARELDAVLVSADLGLTSWADKLGVPWLLPEKFKPFIEAAAAHKHELDGQG